MLERENLFYTTIKGPSNIPSVRTGGSMYQASFIDVRGEF